MSVRNMGTNGCLAHKKKIKTLLLRVLYVTETL